MRTKTGGGKGDLGFIQYIGGETVELNSGKRWTSGSQRGSVKENWEGKGEKRKGEEWARPLRDFA